MSRMPLEESHWTSDGTRKQYFVYIMSNKSMTLYTGITNDVIKRAFQHKNGWGRFTSMYHCTWLVYFECFDLVTEAIVREKQIKGWTRAKKIALIKTMNPQWRDLATTS